MAYFLLYEEIEVYKRMQAGIGCTLDGRRFYSLVFLVLYWFQDSPIVHLYNIYSVLLPIKTKENSSTHNRIVKSKCANYVYIAYSDCTFLVSFILNLSKFLEEDRFCYEHYSICTHNKRIIIKELQNVQIPFINIQEAYL